jgi:hypothetical protein
MAAININWLGNAAAVAQVDTFTPGGTIESGDVFILTVAGERGETTAITFIATATTVANVAAGLMAAWNASTNPLCTGITATGGVTAVVLTADTAGVPFYVVGTTTETGGGAADDQTFVKTATTANSGPYDYNTLANWWNLTAGIAATYLPGDSAADTVYVEGGYIKYGLIPVVTVALAALYATKCQIGQNGSAGVAPSYLKIKATKIEINYNYIGTPNFLFPINIDNQTTATTITVYNTGTNSISTEPGVNLKVVEATSDVYIYTGKVGIAFHSGEVSTLDNIYILGTAAYVYLGVVTLTGGMIEMRGGYCYCATTVTIPEVDIYSGYFYQLAAATITALNAIGGTADTTLTNEVVTITTAKRGNTGTIKYKVATDVLTNKIQPYETTGNVEF